MSSAEKGKALFLAAKAVEDCWLEVDRLIELFDRHAEKLLKTPVSLKKGKVGDSDIPENVTWAYSYNYQFFRRKKKNPDAWVSIEVRLCWDSENQIKTVAGEDFCQPLILVKGSTIDGWEVWEPNLCDKEEDYHAFGKLLWSENKSGICWIFAVPLFAITSEDDLIREIVKPIGALLSIKDASDPLKLQNAAFVAVRHVLSWKDDETGGYPKIEG
jgi:hypothetical protein